MKLVMLVPTVLAGSAVANVTLISRQSEVAVVDSDWSGPIYQETRSFSGFTDWSVQLQRAPLHEETVSPDRIAGRFQGLDSTHMMMFTNLRYSAAMTVRFRVDGAPATATLDYAAVIRAVDQDATSGNVALMLTNVDTGAVLFDLFGQPMTGWFQGDGHWAPSTWTSALAVGDYELRAASIVTRTQAMGGSLVEGSGDLTVSLSLVPAPGAASLLAASVLIARRRR